MAFGPLADSQRHRCRYISAEALPFCNSIFLSVAQTRQSFRARHRRCLLSISPQRHRLPVSAVAHLRHEQAIKPYRHVYHHMGLATALAVAITDSEHSRGSDMSRIATQASPGGHYCTLLRRLPNSVVPRHDLFIALAPRCPSRASPDVTPQPEDAVSSFPDLI